MMKRLTYLTLLFALALAGSGCGREHRQIKAQLLEQSREAVKKLDTPEAQSLQERIDSLASATVVADTVVGDVCAEVAKQLRLGRHYKELWAYVNDAGEQLERINDDRAMQDRLMNMNLEVAAGYYDLRLYDRHLQLLIKLKPTAERYGFDDHLAEIHIDMAATYSEKNQYDRALSELQHVLDNKDKIADKELIEIAYYNIAWAWRGKENYDKAVEYGMLALHHVPEGNTLLEMRTRVGIATFYNRMQEYSLAQRQLEMARDYYVKNGHDDDLLALLPKLGISQWKQGHTAQAQEVFEQSLAVLDRGSVMAKMAALNQYAIFCDSMGMHDKQIALQKELLKEYEKTIQDSGNEMLTQLYSDELATSDKNLRDYRRSRVELWVSIAVFLSVLAGAVWWMRRRYLRLRQQKCEVEAVSDERQEHLMVAAVDEMKFTAFTQSLAQELQELQKTVANEPPRVAVQELRKVTSRVMRMESERDNELVTLANAEFFKRLLERFPDLTNNDLRVCALLRRGMTSKEIADIMCRESQTIDITRTRIRRKCGLQPDEDLNTFMMKI